MYLAVVGIHEVLSYFVAYHRHCGDKFAAVADGNGLDPCAVLYFNSTAAALLGTYRSGTDMFVIGVAGVGRVGLDMSQGRVAHGVRAAEKPLL